MTRFNCSTFVMAVLSAALLCACDRAPKVQGAMSAQLAPVEQALAPAATALPVVSQPTVDPLQGCEDILLDEAVGDARFLAANCPASVGAEIRFVHKQGTKASVGAFKLDDESYSAIVDATARLWNQSIVTVDLAQERGGTLVVANWRGGDFTISRADYLTGDEESLGLDYQGAAFVLTTQANGKERLVEVAEGENAGRFERETVSCRADAKGRFPQSLELTVNADGRVNALGYVGMTPQENGAFSCSIDADRGDGESTWTDKNGETIIAFKDDGKDDEPNRIRIRSEKGQYTVDFEVKVSSFCGQSSVSATQIKLQVDDATCKSVGVTD